MLGAIFGDITGSVYERHNTHDYYFRLLSRGSRPTDDSYMTLAVAKALMESYGQEDDVVRAAVVRNMQDFGHRYPRAGYGRGFRRWLESRDTQPYYSCGNGSAMRVSAAGWLYRTLEETLHAAKLTAEVTHNHPEGIKGAQAIAAAVFLARAGASREDIVNYIGNTFDYNLFRSLDKIRETYTFHGDCQGTVPEAIIAFFESESYEDAIRKAVSLGGDSDTIACMTGAIAEAFYGMPGRYRKEALDRLDPDMQNLAAAYRDFYRRHSGKPLDGWQEEIRACFPDEPYLKYNKNLEDKIRAFHEEDAMLSARTAAGNLAGDAALNDMGPNPVPVLHAILRCMQAQGHVLIPVKMPDVFTQAFDPETVQKGDTVTFEEDMHFTLIHLESDDGSIAMPVFTSNEKLVASVPDGVSVISNFFDEYMRQVLEMEDVEGIVINPGPEHFILRKDVLQVLLEQAEREKIRPWTSGPDTRMTAPENVPGFFPELLGIFAMNNLPTVNNIWLLGLEDGEEKHWCLAIRADQENDEGMRRIYEKIENFIFLMEIHEDIVYKPVDECTWAEAILVYSDGTYSERFPTE